MKTDVQKTKDWLKESGTNLDLLALSVINQLELEIEILKIRCKTDLLNQPLILN